MDDRTIVRAEFSERDDGFYYELIDAEGDRSELIGPYEDLGAAETGFTAAMEVAAVEMIKQTLGLED